MLVTAARKPVVRLSESPLWSRVGEIAERAPSTSDLRHHRLHLFAASWLRERGRPVSAELRHAERHAAAVALGTEPLMRRIREATDAPMVIMKGVEAAARWPSPRLRPWKDLDLLVEDADAVQAALLAAGFVELGPALDYRDSHHLRPLGLAGAPLSVEVHARPKWPRPAAPTFAELAEPGIPAALGVPDVFAPSAAHHAVLLAGHAWEHDPLGCVGSLVDVAAAMLDADPDALGEIARRWDIPRIWATTARATDDLLLSGRPRARAPLWRRHLLEARERTVFEGHVERLVAPVAAAPLTAAPLAASRAILQTLRPWPGEGWSSKLRRARQSLRDASARESDHDRNIRADRPED
jgi:hypothetical protein